MAKKVTQKELVDFFENLYKTGAIYLWGANGDTISKDLVDRLYAAYGSDKYNRDYYNAKLAEGKSKIGADCSGSLFKMSGYDTTAKGYFSKCKNTGLISALPKDTVCLVFNKALTHVGLYCGNGDTIEMKSSVANCVKESLKTTRWAYYGLPDFVDYSVPFEEKEEEIAKFDTIITDYQKWLNDSLNKTDIKVDGKYGPNTKKQTVRMIQHIYNVYFGKNIAEDGSYGDKTRKACPGYSKLSKNAEAFQKITYIIHVYLYAVKMYAMTGIISDGKVKNAYTEDTKSYVADYQSLVRGLLVDGLCGSATLYQMFK